MSRLPTDESGLELELQAAHWLFAFEPAGMATFRALALLACQPVQQDEAVNKANENSIPNPFSRSVILESLRLWPTTPVILRELTKNYNIGGQTIEKGTSVIIFAPSFIATTSDLTLRIACRQTIGLRGTPFRRQGWCRSAAGPEFALLTTSCLW